MKNSVPQRRTEFRAMLLQTLITVDQLIAGVTAENVLIHRLFSRQVAYSASTVKFRKILYATSE